MSDLVWSAVAAFSILSSLSWCAAVITPAIEPEASAIITLVPSEEFILKLSEAVVCDRFVLTFVTLAVLASISAKSVLASLSSVTWSSPI